jgi:hypothetical protein
MIICNPVVTVTNKENLLEKAKVLPEINFEIHKDLLK